MIKIPAALLTEGIDAYPSNKAKKASFHKAGMKFLKGIADKIGLATGDFYVSSNKGRIDVSGTVTLQGEHIYIQLLESCLRPGIEVLYRSCEGRQDYCGKRNRFIRMRDLASNPCQYEDFINLCKKIATGEVND